MGCKEIKGRKKLDILNRKEQMDYNNKIREECIGKDQREINEDPGSCAREIYVNSKLDFCFAKLDVNLIFFPPKLDANLKSENQVDFVMCFSIKSQKQ